MEPAMGRTPSRRAGTIVDREFAAAVRRARERLGLTMRGLAAKAGVDHGQVSRLEKLLEPDDEAAPPRGVSLAVAAAIAGALGISIDRIVRKTRD